MDSVTLQNAISIIMTALAVGAFSANTFGVFRAKNKDDRTDLEKDYDRMRTERNEAREALTVFKNLFTHDLAEAIVREVVLVMKEYDKRGNS